MIKIRFFQVDAFADKQFRGNPAGICLLYEALSEKAMQSIAAENNLSETAFLYRVANGYNLRWFTPTVEVDLCGHATLASAHILWQEGMSLEHDVINFYTKSGLLTARKDGSWIALDFPASFGVEKPLPTEIIDALDIKPIDAIFSETRYIVELTSQSEVVNCLPDFKALKNYDTVVITSRGDEGSEYDFVSRTFAPSHGVDEDPVTGSSHCCLTPYWAKKLDKTNMFAYQASARGGEIRVSLANQRVLFAGKAVTVIDGYFIMYD